MNAYDYLIWRPTDELYHHGIKGQKWGDRNGPPYPLDSSDHSAAEKKASGGSSGSGDDIIIKKGSKVKYVANEYLHRRDDSPSKELYDPEGKYQSSEYKIVNAANKLRGVDHTYKNEIREKTFETLEDLKSPSMEKQVEMFSEAYSKNHKEFSRALNMIELFVKTKESDANSDNASWGTRGRGKEFLELAKLVDDYGNYDPTKTKIDEGKTFTKKKKLKSDSDQYYAYMLYKYGYESTGAKYQKEAMDMNETYINSLKSKGYNAIIDDSNKKYYSNSAPIINLNGDTTLKEVDNVAFLASNDCYELWKEICKYPA